METQSASKAPIKPITKPKVAPKKATPSRAPVKKQLALPIPEEMLMLAIDDNEGVVSASMKSMVRFGLAGAFLAELVMANKIQMAGDRLTMASTEPTGDSLCDDILAMITSDNKPRKLGRWIQAIGSKLTIKQVALRLVELKVIVIDNKQYAWVIPYPAFPQVQASAKYLLKQHLRGIILAGEPANPADIVLLSLLKGCDLLRLVFTQDERKSADKKVDALVQGEVFGEAVAKLLAKK
jgi:golgi phosphoprotein 3